ncbi:hypothetical protein SEVIR_2G374650v4 [Setaria viridis]|uniref:Uncharacterized protein n=1 Tax=Setaria viridis TaxID=4556 RepID=A0A4U6VZH3_SETVI|nr:hypothetical protein SEVIR_2G374650v2 [Setaria viridis]
MSLANMQITCLCLPGHPPPAAAAAALPAGSGSSVITLSNPSISAPAHFSLAPSAKTGGARFAGGSRGPETSEQPRLELARRPGMSFAGRRCPLHLLPHGGNPTHTAPRQSLSGSVVHQCLNEDGHSVSTVTLPFSFVKTSMKRKPVQVVQSWPVHCHFKWLPFSVFLS